MSYKISRIAAEKPEDLRQLKGWLSAARVTPLDERGVLARRFEDAISGNTLDVSRLDAGQKKALGRMGFSAVDVDVYRG